MTRHKLFKVNQDAIIQNAEGKIFILEQMGKWKLPGGRLEGDKTPEEGLLREIKEETGIESCNIERVVHVGLSESKNTYRITFLCKTEESAVKLSDEHTDFVWITLDQLDDYEFEYEETKYIIRKTI